MGSNPISSASLQRRRRSSSEHGDRRGGRWGGNGAARKPGAAVALGACGEGGVSDATSGNRRWAFLLAVGVSDIGTGLYLPVAVLYLVDRGIGQALTGSILAIAALISLPLPALVGHLVDRFGARPVLASAMWLQAASMFCYLLVTGPAMAGVAAVLGAVGLRVFWSSVFALASELAGKTSSDRFFARTSAI